MDRTTIETALDSGRLDIAMNNSKFWRARRNGKTQTWKKSPERFSIPVKVGLRECFRIDNSWLDRPDLYRIVE
jgi:hypothetical protein